MTWPSHQVQFILGSACAAGRRLQNGDGDGDGAGDAGDAGDGDGNDAGTAQNVTGGEVSALTFVGRPSDFPLRTFSLGISCFVEVIEFPPDQPEAAESLSRDNSWDWYGLVKEYEKPVSSMKFA